MIMISPPCGLTLSISRVNLLSMIPGRSYAAQPLGTQVNAALQENPEPPANPWKRSDRQQSAETQPGLPDKGVFKVDVVRVKNEKNEQLINRLVVSGATILNYESPCEHGVGGLAWSERNT